MESSTLQKSFALRTFFQSLFFSILLFAVVAYFYWQSQAPDTAPDIMTYASMFAFLVLYGLLPWIFQKSTFSKLTSGRLEQPKAKKAVPDGSRNRESDRLQRQTHEKRLFMHLFAVLQREGRLLDFLNEDLSLYEDDQIGAAVRSIHENCKKSIDRYLSAEPVMQQAEGETIEIPAGFDPNAVKLVGNVVGQPPFTGTVRHRGWQLRSTALPKLSETGNPDIIAPAEVEIQ